MGNRANKKIQAPVRIFLYMSVTERKLLMNTYFISQFGYCRLVWMNHSKILSNRINGLHEVGLRSTKTFLYG